MKKLNNEQTLNNAIEFELTYDPIKNEEKKLRILGNEFVKKNKCQCKDECKCQNKCKIIYKDKKYALKDYLEEIDSRYNHKDKIKFNIVGIEHIINFDYMFKECKTLLSLLIKHNILKNSDNTKDNSISEFDSHSTHNNDEPIFGLRTDTDNQESTIKCSKQTNDNLNNFMENNDSTYNILINAWKTTKKIISLEHMFYRCKSLIALNSSPDIYDKYTLIINKINGIFYECNSLISIPDISKLDTSKVENMSNLFNGCKSLKSLPNIAKWDTSNVKNMSNMFYGCTSLESLPDLSSWKTENVVYMNSIFYQCK